MPAAAIDKTACVGRRARHPTLASRDCLVSSPCALPQVDPAIAGSASQYLREFKAPNTRRAIAQYVAASLFPDDDKAFPGEEARRQTVTALIEKNMIAEVKDTLLAPGGYGLKLLKDPTSGKPFEWSYQTPTVLMGMALAKLAPGKPLRRAVEKLLRRKKQNPILATVFDLRLGGEQSMEAFKRRELVLKKAFTTTTFTLGGAASKDKVVESGEFAQVRFIEKVLKRNPQWVILGYLNPFKIVEELLDTKEGKLEVSVDQLPRRDLVIKSLNMAQIECAGIIAAKALKKQKALFASTAGNLDGGRGRIKGGAPSLCGPQPSRSDYSTVGTKQGRHHVSFVTAPLLYAPASRRSLARLLLQIPCSTSSSMPRSRRLKRSGSRRRRRPQKRRPRRPRQALAGPRSRTWSRRRRGVTNKLGQRPRPSRKSSPRWLRRSRWIRWAPLRARTRDCERMMWPWREWHEDADAYRPPAWAAWRVCRKSDVSLSRVSPSLPLHAPHATQP